MLLPHLWVRINIDMGSPIVQIAEIAGKMPLRVEGSVLTPIRQKHKICATVEYMSQEFWP